MIFQSVNLISLEWMNYDDDDDGKLLELILSSSSVQKNVLVFTILDATVFSVARYMIITTFIRWF